MRKYLLSALLLCWLTSWSTAQNWINFKNNDGAFSIHMPGKPTDFSKQVAVELEETEQVKVQIYMYVDEPNKVNYMVAYNDYPLGYIIENPETAMEALVEEIKLRSTILSQEPVELGQLSGRKVKLVLDKKYYAEMFLYIRGNRVYKILMQSGDPKISTLPKNEFFGSFKLEPYAKANTKMYKADDADFSFSTFHKPIRVLEQEENEGAWMQNFMYTYATYKMRNPKSGGSYILEECFFTPYYKAYDLDSFYNGFRLASTQWDDSLVHSEWVEIDGKRAMVFTLKSGNTYARHAMLVSGNKFFMLSGYATLEDLNSEESKVFFNSLKMVGQNSSSASHSIFTPKADLLFAHLKSEDETKRMAAKSALNYYVFDSSDRSSIFKAIENTTYPDDQEEDGTRRLLLNELMAFDDDATLSFYQKLYLSEGISDPIKEKILSCIGNSKRAARFDIYANTFFISAPNEILYDGWTIFKPFEDSLAFASAYFNKLIPFINQATYRTPLLRLASNLSENSAYTELISQHEQTLFKYIQFDLADYLKALKTDEYVYKPEIYAYLNILKHYKSANIAKDITDKIAKSKSYEWVKNEALLVRIFNDLSVKQKTINKLSNDLSFRMELMKVYERKGTPNKLPAAYWAQEELAKMVIYNYFSDEEPPSIIKVLGSIQHQGKTIYVLSCSYGEEAYEKYIGMVGPFNASEPTLIAKLKAYSNWDEVSDDWKAQAENMLDAFEEFAY